MAEVINERSQDRFDTLVSDIDTKRFSLGPDTEVALEYWDHTISYRVRRENSGHQVVVHESVHVDWSWHIAIASGSAILTTIISILFGMPLLYGLFLGVLLGFIVIGLIAYEKKMNQDNLSDLYQKISGIEGDTALIIDEPVWESIKTVVKRVYDDGMNTSVTSGKRGLSGWLQRLRPMPSSAMDIVLLEMRAQLNIARLKTYERNAENQYTKNPELITRLGYGSKHCTCCACDVADKLGVKVDVPGIARRKERDMKRVYIGRLAGLGVAIEEEYRREKTRTKAQQQVQSMDKKKQAKIQAELAAKRKEKAREYVADKMAHKRRK